MGNSGGGTLVAESGWMRRWRGVAAALLLATAVAGPVYGQGAGPEEPTYHEVVNARGETKTLTLQESIAAALENNVQVHLKNWELELAKVQRDQARAADLMTPDPVRALQAEEGVEIARQQLELARTQAAKQAEADYYQILRLRNLLQVTEEAIALAERQEEIARQRSQVGSATRRDVLAAQAEVARSRQQQRVLRDNLAVALVKFQQTVGVEGAVPAFVDVQPREFDFDVEKAVDEALQRRIELWQLATGVAAAEKALELATNDYTAGLTREAARVELEMRRRQLRQAQEGIELEVRAAYQKMREQHGRITVTEAELAEAEETMRVLEAMFRADMVTQVEVMEALTGLIKARTDVIHARFDVRVAELDFFSAIGWTLAEREAWEKETGHRDEG